MNAVILEAGKYNISLTEEMFSFPVKIMKEKVEKIKKLLIDSKMDSNKPLTSTFNI